MTLSLDFISLMNLVALVVIVFLLVDMRHRIARIEGVFFNPNGLQKRGYREEEIKRREYPSGS